MSTTEIIKSEEYALTNKKQDEKIKTLSLQLFDLNVNFSSIKQEYELKREAIQKQLRDFIEKKNTSKVTFNNRDSKFKFQNVQQVKIFFNIDELESKLDKSVLKQIIHKEYRIIDFEGLVKYLKSCGVDPKEFKKYLDVTKSVDTKKINQLSDIGVITDEDLKGTYTISKNTGYIKIVESEE